MLPRHNHVNPRLKSNLSPHEIGTLFTKDFTDKWFLVSLFKLICTDKLFECLVLAKILDSSTVRDISVVKLSAIRRPK